MKPLPPGMNPRPATPRFLSLYLACILVAGCPPSSSTSNPPQANAGPGQTVNTNATVTLDGSASNDPDGDPLVFSWRQTLGSPVTLNDASASVTTFTAPAVGTTLVFELTVSDGQSESIATTIVSVQAVDLSARVFEMVQPSILDDPAYSGRFPEGWAFPTLPPAPGERELDKGAPGWIDHLQGGPAFNGEVAAGATQRIELQLAGISILMGSAKWSGTTDLLNVTLSLDDNLLTTGKGYSTGIDRGGSVLTFVTAAGGKATLALTNTSSVTVKVRLVLGSLPL